MEIPGEVIAGGRLPEACIRPVESSLVSVLAHPYTQVRLTAVARACSERFALPVPDL